MTHDQIQAMESATLMQLGDDLVRQIVYTGISQAEQIAAEDTIELISNELERRGGMD